MQLLQQLPCGLFGLLLHDVLADGVAAAFLRRADFADIVEFDEVPAELGADGTADLAFFQFLHRAFKFGHHHAVAEPAQIAALRRTAVLRILSRQFAEITALFRLRADFVDNGFGSGYGVFFFRLNQNMLGTVLARSLTFGKATPCCCARANAALTSASLTRAFCKMACCCTFCATSASAV